MMSPELHIQRFLEGIKGRESAWKERDFPGILKAYARYLKARGAASIKVQPETIAQFLEHLYRRACFRMSTIRNYRRMLAVFYRFLKGRGVVDENPVRDCPAADASLRPPGKDRAYTNEEILKAFVRDWRTLHYTPMFYSELAKIFRKIGTWLKGNRLKLSSLLKEDIASYAAHLESYRKKDGASLSYRTKLLRFQYLRWLIRWLYRNGYREDDPTEALEIEFRREEVPGRAKVLSREWAEYKRKYYSDQQGRWRPATFKARESPLNDFFMHLDSRLIHDPAQISASVLERYRDAVCARREWKEATQWHHLMAVRSFLNWLERSDQILVNPARKIHWPKRARGLPARLMSEHEVKSYFRAATGADPLGIRNRAVFELMYSSGLRAGEVAGLRLSDIDFEGGMIRVNEPKGGPDYQRVIPIGRIALDWLKRYISDARGQLPSLEDLVFTTTRGNPMAAHVISAVMKQYAFKQTLRKTHSSHSWRVTCATAMLRNRADIRHVQEQLGHRSLDSTQLYTRLCPMDLKKAHEKTHPREKEWRRLEKAHEARERRRKKSDTAAPIN